MAVIVCEYTDTERTKIECKGMGCQMARELRKVKPQNTPQPHTEFVLVPRKATEAMRKAGAQLALNASLSADYPWLEYMGDVYTAMLEAAQPVALEDVRRELIEELIEKAEGLATTARAIRAEIEAIPDDGPWAEREFECDDAGKKIARALVISNWLRDQLKEGE